MGLAQEENLVVFLHSPDKGNREMSREEVENARGSGLKPAVGNREHGGKDKEQASSSVPNVKAQTDVKSSTSLEANPAARAKIPFMWRARCTRSRMIIGIFPCVIMTSLETDAFMANIACFDMLMVRRNPARGREKRELKEQLQS